MTDDNRSAEDKRAELKEEPLMKEDDTVSIAEARRRVQRAMTQLRLVDSDLAILEARDRHDESVVEVARRAGRVEAEIDVIRREVSTRERRAD